MSSYASPYHDPDALPRNPREYRRTRRSRQGAEEGKSAIEAKRKSRPWLLWLVSSVLIVAGLSWQALNQIEQPAVQASTETAQPLLTPPANWDPVASPAVFFAFDMPELQLPTMAVEARNYREGGREDALSIGTIADPFYLRVIIDRSRQPRSESFYLDLVRSAAHAGLSVKRTTLPSEHPNKFGSFEVAETTLAGNTDAKCLAFRGKGLDGRVALHGWLCGEDRFIEKDMLACFIDRLTATPALRERDLETALRSLDRNRTDACTMAMNRISAE